ncbi:MAG: glycosyltransferase family 39 protein [Hyphomicrobiaceae bacterium]|nr:glycosyltransferase family 39 protein [Hyphomicrobiaceae bacterium]
MQDTSRPIAAAPLPGRPKDIEGSTAVLIATIAGFGLLRAWLAACVGLTEDEAYYRLWALVPSMGYLDHPPMVGWMIAFGRSIAGDTPLGIRLAAILVSLAGPLALWRTSAILFGPLTGRRAVWLALAMPLLAVGGVIITPDIPSVLFWGLAGWALAELHVSGNANWWLAVGLFAGLGLLSKYSNLFVGASILLWLVLVPANRPWFRSWQLWAGGAIAIALAVPVLAWNYQHDWASFAKQFGRVARGHLSAAYLFEVVGASLGLMSPVIAVLAALGLVKLVRAATKPDPPSALLAASMLPFLVYLLVHALHDRVQANWLAPLYPTFAICAALALGAADLPTKPGQTFGRLGQWAVGSGLVLSFLIYWHALNPIVQLPGQKDPTSQTRGWRALAAEVERLRLASGACWIATSNYATTGQLAYELKDSAPVVQLTERIRYLNLPAIDPAVLKCPALYVELDRRADQALLKARFGSVRKLAGLTRTYAGVPLAGYAVYLADGLDPATLGP